MINSTYIKSPLNYTGGKHKLLPDIIPTFAPDTRKFVDLFAGGFNVGINAEAEEIYCNDQINYIIDLYRFFRETPYEDIIDGIYSRINEYSLSDTNEEGFKLFRTAYNHRPNVLDLFVLTCYSFNHQIRFNSKHEFNTPFGRNRSSYNNNIERNVYSFCNALQDKNIFFSTCDFTDFDFTDFDDRDFVYCDPPYLISTGSYNDGKRGFKNWTVIEEEKLLLLLDKLSEQGVRFALSNVFYHKGDSNNMLIEWSEKYEVIYLNKTYSNCSYQLKNRGATTVEVIVTNNDKGANPCQQMSMF